MPSRSSSSKPRKKRILKQGASQYIQATRWMVEDDYRHKLSPEVREYLDTFNEVWAGDNPQLIYRDKKTRRELWRQTQKTRRDAMSYRSPGVNVELGNAAVKVRANQEDVIIDMLDQHVQPSGVHLKDRVRARREAREVIEHQIDVARARAKKRDKRAAKGKG